MSCARKLSHLKAHLQQRRNPLRSTCCYTLAAANLHTASSIALLCPWPLCNQQRNARTGLAMGAIQGFLVAFTMHLRQSLCIIAWSHTHEFVVVPYQTSL